MGGQPQRLDAFLAERAGRRSGVVTRRELRAAGYSARVIDRKIAAGGLIPIHPGIYLVGHLALAPLAYETAAILACQPRAMLSHTTAARLWRLPVPAGDTIHVTVVGRNRRSLKGVSVHRIAALGDGELRRHKGLPIACPALTLLDLAGALTPDRLARALNEARVLGVVTEAELRSTIDAHPLRSGVRALRALLASERGPTVTHSEAERRALVAMRVHGIAPDATNFQIGPYRADFWFERERVAVEVDGYRYHSTPKRFVDDRRRTAYLAARGIVVFPLTWADISTPQVAMQRLRGTLVRRRDESDA